MTTPTETLIQALRILANDIQSEDGVANAAILELAQRMEEMDYRIKRMEEIGNIMAASLISDHVVYAAAYRRLLASQWKHAKEAKP